MCIRDIYDCRHWAAFYLFLRIAVLLIFACTQTGYFVIVAGMLMIPMACLTAVVRPYKQNIYNILDIAFFLVFSHVCISMALITLATFDHRYLHFAETVVCVSFLFPPVYAVGCLLHKLIPKFIGCMKLLKRRSAGASSIQQLTDNIIGEESLLLNHNEVLHYN